MKHSPENQAHTLRAVSTLTLAFPAWKPGKETIRFWVESLSDLDPVELDKAIRFLVNNDPSPFPPSIGKIRARIDPVGSGPAIPSTGETDAERDRRALPSGGMGHATMLDIARASGFHHLAWHLEHPGGGKTKVPGVVRIFPERGPRCPCEECAREFAGNGYSSR